MQTQSETAELQKESQNSKTPIIYLVTSVKNEVYKTLLEGLNHLDAKVITEDDFEEGLKKAHMAVILDENFDKIKKAWENGVVTITPGFNDQIKDYNPNTESGNAFVFENANEWEIFAAIVRAVETYKFPYDWKFIVRSCKASA